MGKELLVNGEPIDYSGLPEHMRDGMRLYMERGIEGGSFLMSVLRNDLMAACSRADSINRHCIFDYAVWLYNFAPPASYGSPACVAQWIASRQQQAA